MSRGSIIPIKGMPAITGVRKPTTPTKFITLTMNTTTKALLRTSISPYTLLKAIRTRIRTMPPTTVDMTRLMIMVIQKPVALVLAS